MAQIFHPSSNTIAKVIIFGAVFFVGAAVWVTAAIYRSPYVTEQGVPRTQAVPFSHEHHVSGLGIDCRYCHNSVETSTFAGMPATKTCITCHSQIWNNSQMLAPVRESWRDNTPLAWTRVHDLPKFVYFRHDIHIQKGVGCATCHGQVDQMPLMWKDQSLLMEWCLECHRAPEQFVRPRDEVFNMQWKAPANQLEIGRKLVEDYKINVAQLANCSICHR